VKFLGFLPRASVAVFPEVLDHQTHILKVPDTGFGMPEPKTLRVLPDQRPRLLDQLRRRRCRGGKIVQGIRPIIHVSTLPVFRGDRKNGIKPGDDKEANRLRLLERA
jgi:hypothetical protein